MSFRRFIDEQGRVWEAWEVRPSAVERRLRVERRVFDRDTPDRRRRREFRLVMPPELQTGWLAFQRAAHKVRLAPIPEGWQSLSDQELTVLLGKASKRSRPFDTV
jgi:hypothetical protein